MLVLGGEEGFGRDGRGMGHFTASLEDDAFINTEAGGEDVASKDGGAMDFNPMFCLEASVDFSTNNDGAGIDLGVDTCAFSDDQGIRGVDLPAEDSSDPNGAVKTELPLKLAATIDDGCNKRLGNRNV